MSSDWPLVSLGDLVDIKHGWPFKSDFFVADDKASVQPVVVAIGNFEYSGGFRFSSTATKRYSGNYPSEYTLEPGEILLVMTCQTAGGEILGIPARIPRDGRVYLHNQRLGRVVPKVNDACYDFLYWLFLSPEFNRHLVNSASGTKILHTAPSRIASFTFRLPPLAEQKRIAGVLEAIHDRINLLREINTTLEAIAQALFKSWFVDFDPVRAKMEGRTPEGMDEATALLFPNDFAASGVEKVPRGWRRDSMNDWLAVLETGRRPKGGVGGIHSGVPSIGAESITRIGEFDFGKTKFVSEDFFLKMKSGILASRDVLLYKDGGKPGVFLPRVSMFGDGFPFDVCGINEHVFRVRLRKPFGQTFLYFWLWSDAVMHELKHRGGKAAIPGINQSDVREQRLLVPPAAILTRFEELTWPLVSKIFGNAKLIQTLTHTRDALLPRLISGDLRVGDEVEALSA